jgi:RNA-directed DNA polymerase
MAPLPFSDILDESGVARSLSASVDDLNRFTAAADQRMFYKELKIPKKGRRRRGQFRTVYKPQQGLALLQKAVATMIAAEATFPQAVQGFVRDRSIGTNAELHLGRKVLLHADVQDFFDAISAQDVEKGFVALGCRPAIAATLTRLCTMNGRLPQGSSASPIIANVVCRYLDLDMSALAERHACRYSRYADDITFSGDSVPEPESVMAVLQQHGFALRDGRCRLQPKGGSQFVTGLTVFDTIRPRVPRAMKRRLRLELHYAARYGVQGHLDRVGSSESSYKALNRWSGWISFLFSIEGPAAQRYHSLYAKVRDEQPPPEDLDYEDSPET